MSDELHAQACEEYGDNLAELALGILTGRDRAATLAHVESCARCSDELEQLARSADAIVQVAPDIEPPVGFEVRIFSRMGVDEVSARRRVRPSRWVLTAAAAVALIVGLTVGWTMGPPSGGGSHVAVQHPKVPRGTLIAAANLTEHGQPVGRVSTYGGAKPWMFMTLDDSGARGSVICQVVTSDGVIHTVGAFNAADGYGAWGAPLRVAPQDVRQARVVSASGTVIATATLS